MRRLDPQRAQALHAVAFSGGAICNKAGVVAAVTDARAYLENRGLDADAQETLGLGLYPAPRDLEEGLRAAGHDATAASEDRLLWFPMRGYVVFPWADGDAVSVGRSGAPRIFLPARQESFGEST